MEMHIELRSQRSPARVRVVAAASLASILWLPTAVAATEDSSDTVVDAAEEPEPLRGPRPYVMAIINGGVVTNVAALGYERDYSGLLISLSASNDAVLLVPTAGIGWVVLPDGSLGPKPPPEPPEALPRSPDSAETGDASEGWRRTERSGTSQGSPGEYPYVLAIINGGVVTNVAALSDRNDYSSLLASLRASNDAVLRVPRGTAGIGWTLMPDGSIAPPKPREGMVWNGAEWRSPGTETVERPSEVRGWMTDRIVPIEREPQEQERPGVDGSERVDALMYGVLIVPDEALEGAPTRERLAERSIVMLESHGETVPVLARCDGLQWLSECLDAALDGAISAYEENSGGLVAEAEQKGLRAAVRRIADSFLQLRSGSST
jgi:hypothetical protein